MRRFRDNTREKICRGLDNGHVGIYQEKDAEDGAAKQKKKTHGAKYTAFQKKKSVAWAYPLGHCSTLFKLVCLNPKFLNQTLIEDAAFFDTVTGGRGHPASELAPGIPIP